jgi:hypothetical protein
LVLELHRKLDVELQLAVERASDVEYSREGSTPTRFAPDAASVAEHARK